MQHVLICKSTNDPYIGNINVDYLYNREKLIANASLKKILPDWLILNRDANQFWRFIQKKFPTYGERRDFIYEAFEPLFNFIDGNISAPVELTTNEKIMCFGVAYITEEWNKMLERKSNDPMGAITSSRSLIEAICKYILDELKVDYDPKSDLPLLYKQCAKSLNLSPDQHAEDIFKKILSGCYSVVDGIGALRNAYGDAHGKNPTAKKPDQRHADLAINLASTMAMFLLETYEKRKVDIPPIMQNI